MFLSDPSFKQTLREAVQTPAQVCGGLASNWANWLVCLQMLDEASLKLAQAVRQNVKEVGPLPACSFQPNPVSPIADQERELLAGLRLAAR